MAVARKQRALEGSTNPAPEPRARPRRVKEADAYPERPNPVADHLLLLEDAFSKENAEKALRYPGRVRLAIMIGAPVALWALIAGAVLGARALF
jgi:hypothetical protein